MTNYCIILGGYKIDYKWAVFYEFLFIFGHFMIGVAFGALYKWPLAQIIIILVVNVILFVYILAIRPFAFIIHLVIEIISYILLLIALIGIIVSVAYEKSGCYECANREGFLCWLILFCLFLPLLLLSLGLLVFSLIAAFAGADMFYKKEEHNYEDIKYSGEHNKGLINNQRHLERSTFGNDFEVNENQMNSTHIVTNHVEEDRLKETIISNKNIQNKALIANLQNASVTEEDDIDISGGGERQNERMITNNTKFERVSSIKKFNRKHENNEYLNNIGNEDIGYYRERHNYGKKYINNKTNTVKLDTDDELNKQKRVLEALNQSDDVEINKEIHNEEFEMKKAEILRNKEEFEKKNYHTEYETNNYNYNHNSVKYGDNNNYDNGAYINNKYESTHEYQKYHSPPDNRTTKNILKASDDDGILGHNKSSTHNFVQNYNTNHLENNNNFTSNQNNNYNQFSRENNYPNTTNNNNYNFTNNAQEQYTHKYEETTTKVRNNSDDEIEELIQRSKRY